MAATAVVDPEVLTEVPGNLKRLVRYIVRGFYSIEHSLVIDLLTIHPCVKEEDLLELLRFDRKQLRAIMNTLKNDKFIRAHVRMNTDADGRATRHNYYFINYSSFVNVVKYKLDLMRKKIETEERNSTSRASFKCPNCQKAFTDLQVNELFDPFSNTFLCSYCRTEVEEEASAQTKTDVRTLMVKFNEQMEPLFDLLKEVEDIKLAPEILEPEPVDLKVARPHGSGAGTGNRTERWAGGNRAGIDYGATSATVTIAMDEDGKKQAPVEQKERPVWMMESTVEGAAVGSQMDQGASTSQLGTHAASAPVLQENDDIMRTLLMHERTSSTPRIPGPGQAASDEESSTSEEEEAPKPPVTFALYNDAPPVEEMESGDEEDDVVVTIGNQKVPYHDVTDEMVQQMTAAEKEAYIQIGKEMYQDMYD